MLGRFGIRTTVASAAVAAAALSLAACGSSEAGPAPPSTPGVAASQAAPTTPATPHPTSPASEPSRDTASTLDAAAVEAALYADIEARYADASPGYYPGTLECGSGSVAVGSALACSYVPDEPFEFGGVFVVVLDADRIGWTAAECCGRSPRPQDYPDAAFCRDLAAPPSDAPREVRDSHTLDPSADYHLSYGLAVWYWYAHGRPDRMDADLDGIPCETVYDPDEIAGFWDSVISLG